MNIPYTINTSAINAGGRELINELLKYSQLLSLAINGQLTFTENIFQFTVTVSDTGTADTEFTVAHGLGKVPNGYIVISNNKAGVVYKSATSWTISNIYLKCNVANCIVVLMVI